MLFPIGTEKNTVSRLPIVTVILILTNILAFVFTIRQIDDDSATRKLSAVRMHILILEARYPDLTVPTEVQQMIDDYRKSRPDLWKWITDENRESTDEWESALLNDSPSQARLQTEMTELCREFVDLQNSYNSLLWTYSYHSYHPKYRSFLSHQFLHGGWMHLLGNMWMLWLCGVVLEDVWGPFVVLAFYLLAGIFAATVHGLMTPNSIVPMLGASGSIAGLMGALLARFPRLKVKMMLWIFLQPRTFLAPVYVLAPLWFVTEIFWGMMSDPGIAHWAHVGGFAFGLAIGFALYAGKVEALINSEEPDSTWKPDEQYLHAEALLEKRETDAAIAVVRNYLKKNPKAMEGWQLLLSAQTLKNDDQAQREETLPALIRLSLTENDSELAATYIAEFRKIGGAQLPASTWLEIGRSYEKAGQWETAAREYEQLGQAYYTSDPASLTALMGAARIFQTKLDRPADAQRLYLAAKNSTVPHLEMDAIIEHGLKQSAYGPGTARKSTSAG